MRQLEIRQIKVLFREQFGVATRSQLRNLGVTPKVEAAKVASGEWDRPTARVVRESGSARSPAQGLMIALLEAGPAAVVSHQSAAWLWGVMPVPARHAVTVRRTSEARRGPFRVHPGRRAPHRGR